ncbi:glycosyltransferase [Flavobacterium cyanobacteriorum]|uniref:Glycosyltransferase n=1 Tax=Flavobacterium cyanobacteriorum TaxID=2022802 RepID=A0A255YVP7_9FLAO|nr:glycosyltransferase family 2 protein [Flavobacterium cyanobacteriorum]OYQ33317.1 glycosyltransferase [Flavobacterium cyanobacteriorum]
MQNLPHISIVSPVYRAEDIVHELVKQIQDAMRLLDKSYEIILVDDRSPDNSWEVMKDLAEKHKELKCLRLSRNFGQHPAIMAGLSQVKGEWVIVMDCDLQDQPKEIINLYHKAKEGYEVVLAKRSVRKDSSLKKISSKIFSWIYAYLTDSEYDNEVANYGIYNIKVIEAVLTIGDRIKFFPLFVKFVGFKTTSIEVEHAERFAGSTSYNLSKLLSLAFNTIISFSNKPLKLFVKFGIFISILSFIIGIYYFYLAIGNRVEVSGFSSIIISIWFLSGIIITTIGVIGIYIGKIFEQGKARPTYIIDEML